MTDTIHLAIYKAKDFTLLIEYELIDDAIEITHVDIQARPVSEFEQRERSRQLHPRVRQTLPAWDELAPVNIA